MTLDIQPFNRRGARSNVEMKVALTVTVHDGSGLTMNLEEALAGLVITNDDGARVATIYRAEVTQ